MALITGVGLLNPKASFFDDNGDPLAAGTVDVYIPGTTTRRDTYVDAELTFPNGNPVVLDAAGRAVIYFNPTLTYKLVVKSAAGVTIYTQDNVQIPNQGANITLDGTTWTGRVLSATAATAGIGESLNGNLFISTLNKASSGVHPGFSGLVVRAPTIGGGGATVTNAATLVVDGAPSGAVNNYALLVQGGIRSRFQGPVELETGVSEGISFFDTRVTGSIPTSVGGYVGAAGVSFAIRATTDSPLRLGSNGIDVVVVQDDNVTFNFGAADTEYLSFQSTDVAHGFTTDTAASTFLTLRKASPTDGGAAMAGYSEAALGVYISGNYTTGDANKGTGASAAIVVVGNKLSGATAGAMGANENIAAFRSNTLTRFILDADGDSHQDVGTAWTNFDSHDDVMALNALAVHVSREDDPYREAIRGQFADSLSEMIGRDDLAKMKLVTFNEDGHHFVNMSKLAMLHTGALRQLGRTMQALAQQNLELRGQVEGLQRRIGA